MITDKNDMLSSLEDWNESLWLCCLCGLVNEDLLEFHILESLVKRADAGGTDDVGAAEYLVLCLALEVLV